MTGLLTDETASTLVTTLTVSGGGFFLRTSPFQPSFHSSDRTQKFSHQNGLFRTMAQPKRLFPVCGTVPQPNHRFKLVSLRCSFNAQTTIPRPLLFSRRRFLVTVANVTLRNADFYKVNRSHLIWRIRYEERFQRTDHVSSNKRITSRLFVTTIFASAVDLNF